MSQAEDKKGNKSPQAVYVRHGSFVVSISKDAIQATLTLTPAIGGGDPVAFEEILTECKNQGIVFGLKEEAIREAIREVGETQSEVRDVVIAEGEPAVSGEDGEFKLQVQLASGAKAKVSEDGSVDFKEQDIFTQVSKGELLAIVTKATEGKRDGRTVKGAEVKAGSGKSYPVDIGDHIRVEEKQDSTHYFSEIDGRLNTNRIRLTVDPVLTIEGDVGPKTGNINFRGAVVVRGNVLDTYEISAAKGIVVEGNVRNAVLRTLGDIDIQKGVIGKNKGRVIAKGNVSVRFAENANIQAGGNIVIHRAALNSRLMAGKRIISVENRGQIIGGELNAKRGAEVKVLGNEQEQKTEISVGSDFDLRRRIKDTEKKLNSHREALGKVLSFLEKLKEVAANAKTLPAEIKTKYAQAIKTKARLEEAIANMKKAIESDVRKLDQPMDATIIVHNTMHRGVRISFGKSHLEPDSVQTGVRIFFDRKNQEIKVQKEFLRGDSGTAKRNDKPAVIASKKEKGGK